MSLKGFRHTEESKRKMSIAHMGKSNKGWKKKAVYMGERAGVKILCAVIVGISCLSNAFSILSPFTSHKPSLYLSACISSNASSITLYPLAFSSLPIFIIEVG